MDGGCPLISSPLLLLRLGHDSPFSFTSSLVFIVVSVEAIVSILSIDAIFGRVRGTFKISDDVKDERSGLQTLFL
jgi:hypothetical protein